MPQLSVYICEDHKIVVHGIVSILSKVKKYKEIRSFPSGQSLLNVLSVSPPTFLILDLNLPDINGLEILKKIRQTNQDIRILILTMHNDPFLVQQTKKEGANGFLLKDFGDEQLLKALEVIEKGNYYLGPKVTIHEESSSSFSGSLQLTPREKDIIRYTAKGQSSQQISDLLFISPHTVNTHRRNIYKKLNFNNIKELIKFAYDNGLA